MTDLREDTLLNITNTHTHILGFQLLWGFFIDKMIFILYKLYILSSDPTLKPTHHRKRSAFLPFQKTSLSIIYKLFS